jgi:ABC-type amino acid transport substrate-binding protein/nitrogen-specific signal transduction histidine kinase
MEFTEEERDFISNHPTIHLASSDSYQPFLIQNGEIVEGHDIELLNLISQKTGLKFKVTLGEWDDIQKRAINREFDGLSTAGYHENRNRYYNPSNSYLKFASFVIVKKGNPEKIETTKDLNGKTFVTEVGNILFEKIAKESGAEFKTIYANNMVKMLQDVISGKADFTILDESVFYIAKESGLMNLIEVSFTVGEPFDVLFWFRKDYPELVTIVNKALNSIPIDIKMKLREKWFSSNGTSLNLTIEEKLFLENVGKIRANSGTDWPPFFLLDSSGKSSGYSSDFLRLIAKKLGIEIEFVYTKGEWKDTVQDFCNGKVDILHPINEGYIRDCGIYLDSPYINDTVAFVTRKHFKSVKKLEDIFGLKVALQKGWEITAWFEAKYRDRVSIHYVENTIDGIKAVAKGDVDVVMDYNSVFHYFIKKYGYYNLKIEGVFQELGVIPLSLAVNENMPLLLSAIQKAKESITQSEIAKLEEKWLPVKEREFTFSKEEKKYLENKSFKVCINSNWFPFSEIGVEIYSLLSKKLPIEIVKTESFEESLKLLEIKKCDILDFALKDFKNISFTSSFLKSSLVIVTKTEVPFIEDFSELDKSIGVSPKIEFPNGEKIEEREGVEKVAGGELFGYVGDLISLSYILKRDSLENLKISGKIDEVFKIGSGVRKEDIELLYILEKSLNSIPKEKIDEIVRNSLNIEYIKEFDYTLLFQILFGVLLLLFIILYRAYYLKKLNLDLSIKLESSVSELRKRDNLIFQQNKMASLGEMVGNIAHQWRQPLAHISMIHNYIISQFQQKQVFPEDILEEINNGQDVIQFMSKTINTFQNFYSQDSRDDVRFELSEVIEKVLVMFKEVVHLNNISVRKSYEKVYISGNINAFSQIILSILQNSVVFFKLRKIKEPKIDIVISSKKEIVKISIQDNAGGIKEENLLKIFDYGFSEREETSSTGVGLYIVKLIITEKFHGEIEAKNRDGGAKFTIELPLYGKEVTL